jgi:histidyl-tRNA synthetase
VAAGGRYDGLVEQLGGPAIPGVGFAMGVERLTMLLRLQENLTTPGPSLFIVWLGDKARDWAFPVMHRLRRAGLTVEMDGEPRSMKSQMRRADKLKAVSVLIVGENELTKGSAALRDMASKQQRDVNLNDIEAELAVRKVS